MVLSRWEPFDELANMHGMMDRLFGRTFPGLGSGGSYLATDIEDAGNAYRITAPVPGFRPEEVDVTFQNGVLELSAQHAQQPQEENRSYVRRELARGAMQRSIQLGEEVDSDNITASVENGMLTVEVPKAKRAEPKKITVGTGAKQLQS